MTRWLSSTLAAALLLAGCSQGLPEAPGELIASDKKRVEEPTASTEDLASLASGNTDFGVALYQQVKKPGENVFFSPFSISQAFAMVYAGARGNTEQQMRQALHFTLPQERLHPAMNALDLALSGRAEQVGDQKQPPPELRVVNATWAQKGYTLEPAFLDVLAQHYGAGIRGVDFQREPESIRSQINDWVEAHTNDRIQELLPEGSVKSDTRLALVNALYFKGAWSSTFPTQLTQSGAFHLLGGEQQQVQMMHRSDSTPRKRGDGFNALALPYVGKAFRMLLIVPDAGRFEEIEGRLSASFLDSVRAEMQSEYLALGIPKFKLEGEVPLTGALQTLGMVDAFGSEADLSGITTQERLAITSARHKAFISVDETGTEAAAATGITIGPVSQPESIIVNRPFLFLIEDVETKTVLFLGRVVKP
ncbi:serpin family protein [Hyalangium rubrum]|uniref:Serpin family protein n=1 Tax=Hyalangium rubrum TaxID=3103134 RepID=A0ABU5H500_9BACT|nr:serpin family protein [Hyalangium sp. s54d21]MDY7228386.1 serpin family protein [Hyalangium sp. s54d21]